MKKFISTFLLTTIVAASIAIFSDTASAQRRSNYRGSYNNGGYGQSYNNGVSTYDRHRKAVNIGVATGVGAIIGALIGGGKGAVIGAAAGVAGGAIITAKQAPRNPYNNNGYYNNGYRGNNSYRTRYFRRN